MPDDNQLISMHLYFHEFVDIRNHANEVVHVLHTIPYLRFNLSRFGNAHELQVSIILRWALLGYRNFELYGNEIRNKSTGEISLNLRNPKFAFQQFMEYTQWLDNDLPQIKSKHNATLNGMTNLISFLTRAYKRNFYSVRLEAYLGEILMYYRCVEPLYDEHAVVGTHSQILNLLEIMYKKGRLA